MRDQEFETVQVRGDEASANVGARRSDEEIRRSAGDEQRAHLHDAERIPPRPAGYGEGREFTVQNDAAAGSFKAEERKSGGTDMLSMLAEIHARLDAVEKRSQETRDIVNTAKERGDVGFDTAHVAHIMQKHFFHDQPDVPDAEKPVAQFDPFTGERINPVPPQPKFDPATGARLQ
jgi:hypothetical protein